MEPFRAHRGKIAVIPGDHIDTDRIIPARFLTRISRFGYGELLFADVRGPEFILDQEAASGATILVVGTNFGCGSSREHAVWAIQQAGFRCVIGKVTESTRGFSDIFRSNSGNCGLLLIDLDEAVHAEIEALGTGGEIEVDLENTVIRAAGKEWKFEIAESTRQQLLQGLDLIGTTLQFEGDIKRYEEERLAVTPGAGR